MDRNGSLQTLHTKLLTKVSRSVVSTASELLGGVPGEVLPPFVVISTGPSFFPVSSTTTAELFWEESNSLRKVGAEGSFLGVDCTVERENFDLCLPSVLILRSWGRVPSQEWLWLVLEAVSHSRREEPAWSAFLKNWGLESRVEPSSSVSDFEDESAVQCLFASWAVEKSQGLTAQQFGLIH